MALSLELFEYSSVYSDCITVVFLGNSLAKLIIGDSSQCFPYNLQHFPNVLERYSLKAKFLILQIFVVTRLKCSCLNRHTCSKTLTSKTSSMIKPFKQARKLQMTKIGLHRQRQRPFGLSHQRANVKNVGILNSFLLLLRQS